MELIKIAELLLIKDKNFKEKERLKDLVKKYIKTCDEISYLENILEDFENLDLHLNHIKRDAEIIKSILPRLSKYTNIPIFMRIIEMLECADKIDIEELEAVRWDIVKEIDNLKDKLKTLENEIKSILIKESLLKIGSSNLEEFLKYLDNLSNESSEKKE